MHKKGLSDIVVTMLIILIAIGAIIIIWNVLRPFLGSTAGLDTQQFTTKLSIPDESVQFDGTNLSVRVSRNAGDGDVVGFMIGLEDPAGNVKTFRQNLSIKELETLQLNVNYTDQYQGDIVEVTISPIFRNNDTGKEIIGQPIASKPAKYKLPSGLVAHWRFDESWADSKGGLVAERSTSTTPTFDLTIKKVGSASARFSNTRGANAFVNNAPNPAQFTIVAFVYPNSLAGTASVMTRGTTTRGYSLQFRTITSSLAKWEFLTDNVIQSSFDANGRSQQWEFLAASYSSNKQLIFYFNTQTDIKNDIPYSAPDAQQVLLIGPSFDGNIDEVMIFERALTAQEVEDIRTKYK